MLKCVLLGTILLAASSGTSAAQETVQGRLAAGDQQLSMNEYYDVYSFDGSEGQALRFEVVSPDFLPGGMLIDPGGNQIYRSLGSALDKVWRLDCRLTASGTWQIAVFESFWQEGDYTLAITELGAATDAGRCDE